MGNILCIMYNAYYRIYCFQAYNYSQIGRFVLSFRLVNIPNILLYQCPPAILD